jgi:2-haloacid dehalogenase
MESRFPAVHKGSLMRLTDFSTLTFDCYGTLIDWESGIVAAFRPWLDEHGVTASGDTILATFSAAEGPQQEATPAHRYPEILAAVHGTMSKRFGIEPDDSAAARFGASVPEWPAFPDSADALGYLEQHYRLVILSNVDRTSFAASNRRLEVEFDLIYTAEDIGSYKPDPRNFAYLLKHTAAQGIDKAEILHTAESLHHDHLPAKRVGLATCWIHRRHAKGGFGATRTPADEVTPDFRFTSMAALAEAHRRECAG